MDGAVHGDEQGDGSETLRVLEGRQRSVVWRHVHFEGVGCGICPLDQLPGLPEEEGHGGEEDSEEAEGDVDPLGDVTTGDGVDGVTQHVRVLAAGVQQEGGVAVLDLVWAEGGPFTDHDVDEVYVAEGNDDGDAEDSSDDALAHGAVVHGADVEPDDRDAEEDAADVEDHEGEEPDVEDEAGEEVLVGDVSEGGDDKDGGAGIIQLVGEGEQDKEEVCDVASLLAAAPVVQVEDGAEQVAEAAAEQGARQGHHREEGDAEHLHGAHLAVQWRRMRLRATVVRGFRRRETVALSTGGHRARRRPPLDPAFPRWHFKRIGGFPITDICFTVIIFSINRHRV